MDWIKKNYDCFLLALSAVVLVAVSGALLFQGITFKKNFLEEGQALPRSRKVAQVDVSAFEQAVEQLLKPAIWSSRKTFMFVSEKYLVKDGKLVNPIQEDGVPIHPPVPNKWFQDNNLDLLAPNILSEDSDSDGFTNLEEFSQKTNPQDKESHPDYITKLRLKRFIKKPFRIVFKSWYAEADNSENNTFQIDTVDLRQPTQFLKIGQDVAGTEFKVIKFEKKSMVDANDIRKDISELTLENKAGDLIILPLNKIVDSPDSLGRFKNLRDGLEFEVRKRQQFSLKTEPERVYKLIDIGPTEAVIQRVDGDQSLTVPLLEANSR